MVGVSTRLDTVLRVAHRALERGRRLDVWPDWRERQKEGRSGFRRSIGADNPWSLAGRCEAPVVIELYGKEQYNLTGETRGPMTVTMLVQCRRCGWCRHIRSMNWAERAISEYGHSYRTWMGTLTFTPDEHALADQLAYNGVISRDKHGKPRYRENGVPRYDVYPCPDYYSLPIEERFARLVAVHSVEITRFIKRVRTNGATEFKYLIVSEMHKEKLSGKPHFHILIHEKREDRPVRKAVLKAAWTKGFSKFSLVDSAGGAVYVCKYMAKDALTRVRASFKYGTVNPFTFACEPVSNKKQRGNDPQRAPLGLAGSPPRQENPKDFSFTLVPQSPIETECRPKSARL